MTRSWTFLKDASVIGNGLKGLAIGLLCNVYFFARQNLEDLVEAIALWFKDPSPEAAQEIDLLLNSAADISNLGRDMLGSGYLVVGILVIVSTGLMGVFDGLRERRVRELQAESESRTIRLTEAQKLLTSAQRRLAHSERLAAIGRMAAGVSHEINNPLGAITGHIRLIAMQIPEEDKEKHAYLEVVQKEARRIREIVKGLNDFARSNPDPEDLRKSTVDIHTIIQEALDAFRPRFLDSNIQVEESLDAHNANVFGRKDHLRMVFNNLISNAAESMQGGGNIILTTNLSTLDKNDMMALKGSISEADDLTSDVHRLMGRDAEFSMPLMLEEGDPVLKFDVIDHGQGMSADLIDKVFEPFVTTKEVGYGLGLGLAITYSIVRSHGGFIDVHSKVGKGSQFTVVLASAQPIAENTNKKPMLSTKAI
jgi:two-component system NtrC family sensor kinase